MNQNERKIDRILIANRGEIAVRVIQSCKRLGIATLITHSSADRNSYPVKMSDIAIEIGPPEAAQSYLNIEKIVAACKEHNADAVHPGYGFLSENAAFARAVQAAGVIFIGPDPDTIQSMGDKIAARDLMEKNGVPVVPGYHGDDQSEGTLRKEAERIGYPVLIKAAHGGGGRGMRRVNRAEDFSEAYTSARREAESAFGDGAVLLEKFVEAPHHIEVQVFGDEHGNIVHLGERECSIQRRHQKVIEESPAPSIDQATREKICDAALRAARLVNYKNAGTVEFIYSETTGEFYFLEMNTRLQVEHPVTEMVTGRDLVEEQIRVASGLPLDFRQADVVSRGHAVEVRLYAENPGNGFLPTSGPVHRFQWPILDGLRVDSGLGETGEISVFYDPMVAKFIAHGADRPAAVDLLLRALRETLFFGPITNLEFLCEVLDHKGFRSGQFTTQFLDQHFAEYRGPRLSAANIEQARTALALLYHEGARNEPALPPVATAGGDLSPWQELEGFRLWN